MVDVKEIEGTFEAPIGAHFAIVVSRFNHFITDRLLEGALDGLRRHGVPPESIVVALRTAAKTGPRIASKMSASDGDMNPAGNVIPYVTSNITGSSPGAG